MAVQGAVPLDGRAPSGLAMTGMLGEPENLEAGGNPGEDSRMKPTDRLQTHRSDRLAAIREQLAAAVANEQRFTAEEVATSLDQLQREIARTPGGPSA